MDAERIRTALRGRRLDVLAAQLCAPIPVLEAFVHGSARLTPALMAGLARLLATPPAPPIKNIPTPMQRKPDMKLAARALKCTAVLDAAGLVDPGNKSRVVLAILVEGKVYSADVAAKSVRKCRATIAEHGAAHVVCLIQGKFDGNTITEAGIVAQVKLPRPE